MPSAQSVRTEHMVPPPLIADSHHALGFAIGPLVEGIEDAGERVVAMYDLGRSAYDSSDPGDALVDTWRPDFGDLDAAMEPESVLSWAIDEERQQIIAPPSQSGIATGVITCVPTVGSDLQVFEYGTGRLVRRFAKIPCVGTTSFITFAASIDNEHEKLYLTGKAATEGWRNLPFLGDTLDFVENQGQPLLIRQLDLAKLTAGRLEEALDWEIDLRYGGCGRREVWIVERAGDDVLTYCSDPRPLGIRGAVGDQGYVVRVPLDREDMPETRGGEPLAPDPANPASTKAVSNAVVRRTPTLAGKVIPFVDRLSDRMLLLTTDDINGNAIWVHEPRAERFVGVVTGPFVDQEPERTAAGFDPISGRAYLLTKDGVMSASVRSSPLSLGVIHPVLRSRTDVVAGDGIQVFSVFPVVNDGIGRPRLFVPITKPTFDDPGRRGYVVIEDATPDPPPPPPSVPDALTTQTEEREGVTSVVASAAAQASGAHVLVAGGSSRIVNQVDPFCHSPHAVWEALVPVDERDALGSCVGDVAMTSGQREYFLAAGEIEAGSESGAVADGQGFAVGTRETATDADVRRAGECYRGAPEGVADHLASNGGEDAPSEPFDAYSEVCDGLHDQVAGQDGPDLRAGVKGKDGRGFPVPVSHCSDFGTGATRNDQASEHDRVPIGAAFGSSVRCDASTVHSAATAQAAGFSLPSPIDPVVSVGRTTTDIRSSLTSDGQITIVESVAQNVVVGPLRIGEIRTRAVARAKGRTDTAEALLIRKWCGVEFEGQSSGEGCVDANDPRLATLIDEVNQVLGRIRLSVPAADIEATPGGYQAVVTKDDELREADGAVNGDETHTVGGLEILVLNDGAEGRSRTVIQLAGVHAEARYGIQLVPHFDVPSFAAIASGFTGPELAATIEEGFVGGVMTPRIDPESFVTLPAVAGRDAAPSSPAEQVFRAIRDALEDALRLLVNDPLQFFKLFVLWLTLAAGPILMARRRQLAGRLNV